MPEIIKATGAHASYLSTRLRTADVAECEANGLTPFEALHGSMIMSLEFAWTIAEGDEPLAMFGGVDCTDWFGPDVAAPWMLGTDALTTTHRRWFLRNTQRLITIRDDRFRRYFNRVDARNTVHIRWLKWAGFIILPAVPWGPFGLPFHPFFRKVESDNV